MDREKIKTKAAEILLKASLPIILPVIIGSLILEEIRRKKK